MRLSHPPSYGYVDPYDLPDDFYVKCYRSYVYDVEDNSRKRCWEIDYDLPKNSIRGLLRYTKFDSFEEVAVACNLLGLRCVKCRWLPYPPVKGKTKGSWILPMIGLHLSGEYIPAKGYKKYAEKFYREKLGKDAKAFIEAFPQWAICKYLKH